MPQTEWERPDIPESELRYAVGATLVEQFAQGHTVADVLRELVQNEYDAQGGALTVIFGADGIEVSGTGRAIDRAGWRRLSVMLGTGQVAGADDVPRKINGIGSKNFGLRSLFIFGDRIYVRSGGRQTLLDLQRGAPSEPFADPNSTGRAGAHIFVPWRQTSTELLEAYGIERESRDFETLARELAPTLMKLAHPKGPKSLRSLTVSSERLGRTLTWNQCVKLAGRRRAGVQVLERVIERSDSIAESKERVIEHEYQRAFELPPEHRSRAFPNYFRLRGGSVSIGVSLRIRRKRPDLEHRGLFYYPLGAANAATGCAISVSAPFEMNADRSAIVDPSINTWNAWLLETTADFAVELLTERWLDAFESHGYLVLKGAGQLADRLAVRLRTAKCWPARGPVGGSILTEAHELMPGVSPEIDALLPDMRRLDARLQDHPEVVAMAIDCGAKRFTVGSTVRFRCAGKDAKHLSTKLGDDAALRFSGFPGELRQLDRQIAFANVFERHRRQLTTAHRADLRDTETTLTAAHTLAAPSEPLWVVDPALAQVSPVPAERQLHPELAAFRSVTSLCEPFDMSAWVGETAQRVAEGTATEDERIAVYEQLLKAPEQIRRPSWPAVKASPVVRDHRGEWAAPRDLVLHSQGAKSIERALRFPSAELSRNPKLLLKLAIRPKLRGSDIVAYAKLVAADPALAADFEETLQRRRPLLTRPTINALGSIAFLHSSRGGLVAPTDALVRTPHLLKCVGPDADFAAGRHASLHELLECRTVPRADEIVDHLTALRNAGAGPPHPEVIYPSLVDALRAQGAVRRLTNDPILFEHGAWHVPAHALLGNKHRRIFGDVLPVLAPGSLLRAYQDLGASPEPGEPHWARFFAWADASSDGGRRRLAPTQRTALRLAYTKLGSLPESCSEHLRVLLDTQGRLHSKADAAARRFLIDDDPATARMAQERGLQLAFADLRDPATRRFYISAGVQLLTTARRHLDYVVGNDCDGPPWFKAAETLGRLRTPHFSSAVYAVVAAGPSRPSLTQSTLRRRLDGLSGVGFVATLDERFTIGTAQVEVSRDVAVTDGRIVMRFRRRSSEVDGLLAQAVAGMAEDSAANQRPLADAVFRILSCEGVAEIQHYLAERGVPWTPKSRAETFDDPPADEDDPLARVADTLAEQLLNRTRTPKRPSEPGPTAAPPPRPPRPAMPPLEQVELHQAEPAAWTPPERSSGGGGGGGGWRPRTHEEDTQDRDLGRRGEHLVFQEEIKRVRSLGFADDRVVWTSDTNPGADHDIRSVDDDGSEIWLEVKSTTARHGRFEWPLAEFELAARKQDKYLLCRVYEADTATPILVRERDPIAKLRAGGMRLDISSLSAEIAPLP